MLTFVLAVAGIATIFGAKAYADGLIKSLWSLVLLGPALALSVGLAEQVVGANPWLAAGVVIIALAALISRRSGHHSGGHGHTGGHAHRPGHATSTKRRVGNGH